MSNVKNVDAAYVAGTYARFPVEIVSGKGSEVYDEAGKRYIDMGSGIGVTSFGIADDAWIAAITAQLGKVQHMSNLYYTQPCAELAEILCTCTGMSKVFFANSGAEANECAIKVARKYAAEKKGAEYATIVTLENSFHGRTLTTLAATGQEHYHELFQPLTPGFVHTPANDFAAFKATCESNKVAGILMECVQGEGGVLPVDHKFMKDLRALCDEKGLLLLCDEVQCGMGRTGEWFAWQSSGIMPDAFSLAKSLASGIPMGAVVANARLADVFTPGTHGSTFGGNPLAAAAALATIGVIEKEGLLERALEAGEIFREGLQQFVDQYDQVLEVRGDGLMVGLVLDVPAADLVAKCREMGLLACVAGGNTMRFLPPLTVKDDELEEAVDIISDALDMLYGEDAE